jgi:glucosamine kinase
MGFYLGIDGGGSKTSCAVGDEKSVLGIGTAPGSNVVRLGEVQARKAFTAAIRQTCAAAHITPLQVTRACVGVAGAARPQISEVVRGLIAELIPGEIEIVGDMVIALEAAFGPGPGVVAISGTGSIAYGRNSAGQTARAGGWGPAISDEGSGHWLGRAAVSAALRAEDEGEAGAGAEGPLLAILMTSWAVKTRDQLVLAANASPPPDFAGLFPAVLSAADSGDSLARAVLTRAGSELAVLAGIVMRRIFSNAKPVPVAMSGGVFAHSALVRQVFSNRLRSEHPAAAVNARMIDAVLGALHLARKGRPFS